MLLRVGLTGCLLFFWASEGNAQIRAPQIGIPARVARSSQDNFFPATLNHVGLDSVLPKHRHILKGASIGAGVGAIGGGIAAALTVPNSQNQFSTLYYVVDPLFGAIIGALVGGLIGSQPR